MPLSRLENFIKNVEGNILYVNPSDQDATDSIENQGNSLTRPFKTIQRALIEAARFSYIVGSDNDKFDKTTILIYPGIHKLDNRAGFSIHDNGGTAEYKNRFGNLSGFSELTSSSNFDIEDPNNVLYHFNSVTGGVIVPRGTSLVGLDLRKTKVLPLFVPDPQNSEIDNAAFFKITGGCYFWQFSMFDGDPNGQVYKNYSTTKFTPNFSHHKLTCFEYADGLNPIALDAVTGGTAVNSTLTDLDTYYFKVANAYGNSSARPITNWPSNNDIEPKLAENQIVGAIQADPIGITSIFSTARTDFVFNGAVGRNIVVTTQSPHNLNVGTPILISGITTSVTSVSDDPIFNAQGGAVVSDIITDSKFAFVAPEPPTVATAYLSGDEVVQVEPDTVTGASPYIFNCSLRSVYGVNGLHADGSKATGFKSMVLAQFTGIGLQKDDNAFVLYNEATGAYNDNTTVAEDQKPLHINSRAIYKPDYYSTHVKVSNGSVLQCVSIFAIGFAQHFVADTGGDQSITNSNSNFGAKALIARKFSNSAFKRDNAGYITHIIPPKEVTSVDESIFWVPLDIGITTSYSQANANAKDRLYAFGYSDSDSPPTHIIDSFRIGSKVDDILNLDVNNSIKTAPIRMEGSTTATNEKVVYVAKNQAGTANSITESSGSIFGLTGSHEFSTGETVRILSDDGNFPDGIDDNQIYFVIEGTANGLNSDQIKLAKTLNETISGNVNPISNVNTIGGTLQIVSRVSDKLPGDSGHPIQYDDSNSNWYISVKGDSSNTIFDAISPLEKVVTSKAYILRKPDTRNLEDRIYKIRYVIPKEFQSAKPPSAGYVFQESSTTIASSQSEYSGNITNTVNHRNIKIIHNVDYDSNAGIATITSEIPHKLRPGSSVRLKKIKSANNTTAADKEGFNGIFDVASIIDTKSFTINVPSSRDPGNYIPIRPNLVTQRDENQPNFSINEYSEVFYTYRVDIKRDYIENFQDGIYHLTCLTGSVNPTSSYFSSFGYSQNVVNLYPQLDRDNYLMDPKASISIAKNDPISEVITDDLRNSITKEFVNDLLLDNRLAFKVEDIEYTQSTGIATVTTDIQHNLNGVIRVSIANSGEGYGYAGAGSTTIYNAKLNGGSGEGATIRFTVDDTATYNMSNVVIVDGGAGYSVGETLTVSPVGIPTYSSGGINYSGASVTVEAINPGSKNSIQLENIVDYGVNTDDFNGVYKITDVPSSKEVAFLLGANNTGIGTYKRAGTFAIAGAATTVTDLKYTDVNTGIVTITTATPHGLNLGNKFKLDYNNESSQSTDIYNGTFTVNEKIDLNTFTFFIGDNVAIAATPSNVGNVLMTGYSSQESDTDSGRENIERRMNPLYVGISTTLNGALTKTSTTITLSHSNGFVKGDYLQIGPEVLRIKEDFTNNAADIIRGVFSTKVSSHEDGSLVKKISPLPVESRRYSILRASGHTFEYVGFGHGNYSTGLPQRQDRVLTQDDQLLSQAEKSDGGVVVYTGMNDTGDFYVGNRRLSSATGQEQTIGIPIPTYVGDDATGSRLSVIFDDVTVKEFIKVEGGAGGVIQSEFNGPVVFNEKITQTSDKGADFKLITLKGTDTKNARRKQTVGINTPADDGDNGIGDIVWKNEPKPGGYLGWVYADEKWRKFGLIATERSNDGLFADSNDESPLGNFTILPSKIGINTNLPRDLIDVQAGLSRFDQLYVAGIATFNETVTLGTVNVDDLDVLSSLDVSGTVSINANGGLGVTFSYATVGVGTTSLPAGIGLTVNSNTSVSGYLGISSSVSVGQELTVTGNTDLNKDLSVCGNTSIGGITTVTGDTDLNSRLDVCGNTSLGGTLYVSGNTTLGGTLSVCGNTTIVSGSLIQFQTVCGNVKGYIQATETNDQHLVIATSGGEDIAFKDGGTGGTTNMVVRGDGNVAVTANISAASGSFAGTVSCENVTTSTLTVKNTATISSDTQVKSRLTVGSGHIGSRNPGFSVIGDSNSSPIVAKVNGKNTTFSVLPWSSGITYITSGIYYDDGAWIHSSDNSYNCLFLISGINGARWYTSNDGSGSWNVASNKSLWNNSGQWDGQLSTNVTYNGNTIWHAGNDGSGSGLDADTLDSIDSSQFLRSDATGTSTQRISFQANATNNWDTIATATGSQGSIEVYNTGDGNDAFMSFHAGGDFAIYFGLDADTNDLSVGGWSMGANKYRVWHAGNDGAGSGLDADNLDGLTWNSSGKDLRGTEIYADNWFRNYNSGEGLYNEATAMHWYSDANNRFRLYSTSTSSAILFTTNGNTVRGYVYADTASSIGFLNTGGQWGLRYLSNDGNSPNLYFLEQSNETWTGNPGNDQGKIEYHSNRFYIASGANSTEVVRFRRSDTNVAYIDNSGNIYSTSSNYRCLTTADEGSGNGIDADTVDGLHVHTGTNNEANKIVRTQANGYIMAGWINTISGDATTNTPDRFYGSYDGYIRYYNRGYTQMYLGNTYKYTTSRRQHTTNADYWVGTMGWGTTDFNTVITWGSGFIDTWSSPGNSPDPMGYSHWVGHQALHYTNGSTNGTGAYGYQMVCGGGTNAPIYVRTTWNGMGSWRALAQYGIISGSSGSLYADIYYDSSNTGYYGDFGSTSRMNQINANMYYSPYPGSDSGLGRSSYPYGWGFQESGAWSSPYPDLVLHYHTGVTLAANPSYNGITFKYDYNNDTVIFRVNGGSSYLYKYYWMYTNTSGYYSDTNSWHINPNDLSSYGSMRLRGSRNSWYGMVIDTGNRPHVMFDGSGNGGFYHQDGGRWSFYYNYSNNCVGMVGSTTSSSFGLYVSKGIYANGTVYAGSDIRIKKDIKTIENALDKVLKLRGVTFIKTNYAENDPQNGKTEMGVIAQEMEKVIPEVVNYAEDIDLYSVSYGNLAGLFIEAFKDQTEIINNLRQEVSDLKNRLGE